MIDIKLGEKYQILGALGEFVLKKTEGKVCQNGSNAGETIETVRETFHGTLEQIVEKIKRYEWDQVDDDIDTVQKLSEACNNLEERVQELIGNLKGIPVEGLDGKEGKVFCKRCRVKKPYSSSSYIKEVDNKKYNHWVCSDCNQ